LNNRISKLNEQSGIITTITFTSAPKDIFVDNLSDIFIADVREGILKIDRQTGNVVIIESELKGNGVYIDASGNIYGSSHHKIQKVNAQTGILTTIAGTGERGYSGDGGPAIQAKLRVPSGIFVDKKGDIYFADNENHRIRKISFTNNNPPTLNPIAARSIAENETLQLNGTS
jgi:streptogramin lyase